MIRVSQRRLYRAHPRLLCLGFMTQTVSWRPMDARDSMVLAVYAREQSRASTQTLTLNTYGSLLRNVYNKLTLCRTMYCRKIL
jgi:hypothetical protein